MLYDDKNFISNKIRLARKQAKMTQEELSERIGITSKQLSRIEAGTHLPSLITFFKIVNILKIDLNDFDIYSSNEENPIRKNFDKIILSSTNEELLFYYKIITNLKENLNLIKK